MNLEQRLALSFYKTITVINEAHQIFLVQHQETHKIYIKKILDVYNLDVFRQLHEHPIPGTPAIIVYCEMDNQLHVIEEYISGTTLAERIPELGTSDRAEILNYLLELCDILQNLHSQNPPIIHRDIKPSNIMITKDQHVVLLDFNAAKQHKNSTANDTVLLGTQGYAAPEQYGFGPSTPMTDIYSLGITLGEMLQAANISDPELDIILKRCTQINPQDRYPDIASFKQALYRTAHSTPLPKVKTRTSEKRTHEKAPSAPKTPSGKYTPPGFRTRKPWKIILSIIVYALLISLSLTLQQPGYSPGALWLERITCLILCLFTVAILFNYRNILHIMPLCRKQNIILRIIGIALLLFITVIIIMIVMLIIEYICFPEAYFSLR